MLRSARVPALFAVLGVGCSPAPRTPARAEPASIATGDASASTAGPSASPTALESAAPTADKPAPEDVDGGIVAAQRAVTDSRFQDIDALVDLARLQLMRDAPISDTDGATDAERAKKNAMRAIAVDDTSTGGRIVLVIALARSFERAGVGDSDGALGLLDLAASTVPPGSTAANAAADVVRGTLALAWGEHDKAKEAFGAAAAANPSLAAAWAGLGDAARSQKRFDEAKLAYRKAIEVKPSSELGASLAAAERGEPLVVRTSRPKTVRGGPLAPPRPVITCPTTVASAAGSAAMCRGVAAIAKASTAAEKEAGASEVVAAWSTLDPLCEDKDAACGPYVATSLAAASRAFFEAKRSAKAIATARIVIGKADVLPKATSVAQELQLEVGDRYFEFCVFDTAAEFYERAAKGRGPGSKEAADRAAFIRAAFQSVQGKKQKDGPCTGALCGLNRLVTDRTWAPKSGR
ncbi:MAG: tetratricopeptide repeat protein [Polyangiaceae bacterium]|nr:tetratricopeptide repeat protein [Polyangiaceae bacterium]